MSFSTKQVRQLRARLPADSIKERQIDGKTELATR